MGIWHGAALHGRVLHGPVLLHWCLRIIWLSMVQVLIVRSEGPLLLGRPWWPLARVVVALASLLVRRWRVHILLSKTLIIVLLPQWSARVICAHIVTFVTQLAMDRRLWHGELGIVAVVVLCGLWLTANGGRRRRGLAAVAILVLRWLRWPCRSRILIAMITVPLLLLLWLSAVIQSLCGVLGETIGIVMLGRLGNVLALEAKVKGVNFVLYRGALAQIGLRYGRFQLARGSLISWLRLGRLWTAVELHVVQMFVDGLLTLVCGRSVEVGHGSFYLVLAIHGARRIMVVIVVDTSQTLVFIRMVVPGLLVMSNLVLISRSVGKVGCLRNTCFVGNVGNRNNGGTMTCGYTAQLRRLETMGIASDLSIERGEKGAFAAIDRIAR